MGRRVSFLCPLFQLSKCGPGRTQVETVCQGGFSAVGDRLVMVKASSGARKSPTWAGVYVRRLEDSFCHLLTPRNAAVSNMSLQGKLVECGGNQANSTARWAMSERRAGERVFSFCSVILL